MKQKKVYKETEMESRFKIQRSKLNISQTKLKKRKKTSKKTKTPQVFTFSKIDTIIKKKVKNKSINESINSNVSHHSLRPLKLNKCKKRRNNMFN